MDPHCEALLAAALAHPDVVEASCWQEANRDRAVLLATVPDVFVGAVTIREHLRRHAATDELPIVAVVREPVEELPDDLGALERGGVEISVFVPPRTVDEARLCELLADNLETAEVGVLDHFLDLGGDSLVAVTILSSIEQAFGRTLTMEQFYEPGTVEGMAAHLQRGASTEGPDAGASSP